MVIASRHALRNQLPNLKLSGIDISEPVISYVEYPCAPLRFFKKKIEIEIQ